MICSVPEVNEMIGLERPIAARLKFTSKKPLIAAPLVYDVGSHKSWLVKRRMSGGLFAGVVPVQFTFPEPVKGLVVPEKE
jgi:hypothetical protein